MAVSIITPWLNTPELCPIYADSVRGAQVITIDNGSEPAAGAAIWEMTDNLGGIYIRNETNNGFSKANNQGLEVATGDIVVFLNSDIEAPVSWLLAVDRDVKPGELAGPSMLEKHGQTYIEGYCIAARRDVWQALGGWPENLPGMYWEDNILCYQAIKAGYSLRRTHWPVYHFNNYTARKIPAAAAHSFDNERLFLEMIREDNNRLK